MTLTRIAIAVTLALAAWQGAGSEPEPALQIGDTAPALRLNDDHGEAVTLGGERETWTVLAFYPKALTPG